MRKNLHVSDWRIHGGEIIKICRYRTQYGKNLPKKFQYWEKAFGTKTQFCIETLVILFALDRYIFRFLYLCGKGEDYDVKKQPIRAMYEAMVKYDNRLASAMNSEP